MNELIPSNPEDSIAGLIPSGPPVANPVPENAASEQAFYASAMYSDKPEEDYPLAIDEIQSNGQSELVNYANDSWQQEQASLDTTILADIAGDDTLSVEEKKNIFMQHTFGGGVSKNLRDRYKQKLQVEDNDITQTDKDHRDAFLTSLHDVRLQADQKAFEVEQAKLDLARSFNYSTMDLVGGMVLDIIPFKYSGSTAIAEAATVSKQSGLSQGQVGWEFMKSMVFAGEANDKMNKWYNGLNDEDKVSFIKDLGDALKATPGFDYNRWNTFRDVLDTPEGMHPLFKHIENVAGILDVMAARGFLAAGFAGGFLRAGKNTLRRWTTVEMPQPKPRPTPSWERTDPIMHRNTPDGAPNAPTGRQEEPLPATFRSGRTGSPLPVEDLTNLQRTRVSPTSPAGTLNEANPKKAKEMFTQAIVEDSGSLAKALGTNKGELMADNLFPKLDKDVLEHADIAKDIKKMDTYMSGVFKDTEFDPFFIPVTQREIDKEKLFTAIKEQQGATYQQANSVVNEKIDSISGVAVYGRNDAYGFSTAEEATEAMNRMATQLDEAGAASLNIANRNNQWYVERPYSLSYDPYDQFLFGPNAVSAHFMGMDVSGVARSDAAPYIWHPTQRLPEWVAKGASRQHRVTGKVNADFMHYIEAEIKSVKPKKELNDALVRVQENQQWQTFKELSSQYPHLSQAEVKDLYRGYSFYKRLTDYQHTLSNRHARRVLESEDFKGIYDETGLHIGNGSTNITKKPKEVFDLDGGFVTRTPDDLQGRTLVRMEEPIYYNGEVFQHALVGGRNKLGQLPTTVLPKIEGYVPRKNIENFYVFKQPKQLKVDGELLGKADLASHSKTIAAAATKADADKLAARLAKEYPDMQVGVKAERADVDDAILTDYKVYKDVMEHSRKRGERLPTLDGKARLENPLEALWGTIQSSVRLDVWKDYDAVFRKNWLKQYGEFTKGEFPNVLTDIKSHATMNAEDLKQWKSAQRLFEQYTNQKYKVTIGDDLWKRAFHIAADSFENVVPKYVSQALRDTASKGNLLVRVPKSLASNLFLYLNPPRQWLVQTQQLLEWSALSKDYLKISPRVIPAMQMAIASKATVIGKHGDSVYAAAHKLSGMSKKEFDATVRALYTEGIPQSVDLNMMLHGAFAEAKQMLDPSMAKQIGDFIGQAVKFPGQVGKTVGYTPAELANTIGTWLFTRERWKNLNPGKNWNTPENIAKISGDAWEIGKAMSTRAGSLPYQDGVAGLFFQFAAVQHKAFMEVFSSKTFTGTERAKLAAVRAALWGTKGLALGGFISYLVGEHTDTLTQEQWLKFEGGLVDLAANTIIDTWLRKPGEKESDLSIAASMSPMPEFLPYADFIINAKQLFDNDPRMPRFAFTGAIGSAMKAAEEIKNIFKVNEYGTPGSLIMSGTELAKLASGYNNYTKMRMLSEFDDKKDKMGNFMGLESTRSQMVAQMFGVISKEEEYLYKINENSRDRKDFIETRAKEIHLGLTNYKGRWGEPDFKEYVRVQRILTSFTPPEMQAEIEMRVDQLQSQEWESRKESAYTDLQKAIQQGGDEYVNRTIAMLRNGTAQDKEIAARLTKEFNIK